jgi:hypothetical protein
MESDGISIGNPLQPAEYSNNNIPPCLSGLTSRHVCQD